MTVRFLGGVAERRRRFAFGPAPTFKQDFVTGGGGALPQGATFSRGTIGTFYNQSGLIATASTDVARFDYDPNNVLQQNLLLSSNFDAANIGVWASGTPTGYTLNVGIAPDGTSSAMFWAGAGRFFQENQTALNNNIYTASIWIRISSGAPSVILAIKDKQTDSIRGSVTASPTSDWQRINCTGTTVGAQTGFRIEFTVSGGTAFFWGAQVNIGSTALPYLATTSTAQTVCAPRGLLIEEARTNLCLQSADFSNASWSKIDTTISTGTNTPNGTTANSLMTEGVLGTAAIAQGAMTITANATVTASMYVKRGNTDWMEFLCTDNGAADGFKCWINLNTGVIGTTGVNGTGTYISSSIQNVGNGWYRVTLTGITSATNVAAYIYTTSASADNSTTRVSNSTREQWGAQLEAGTFATSYIPTTSATVTRNFDNLSITSTNFASWFNQTTGTFAVQYDVGGSYNIYPAAFTVNSNGGFNTQVGGNASWFNGSTNIITSNAVSTLNTTRKEALGYAASSRALCLNGGAIASDANVPFSGTLTGMYFGNAYGTGTQNINGHIRSFSYYNYTLTNAQLQQVTT